jgi:hypothetical protein
MKWNNGWSAAGTFDGEFSNVTSSYAGKEWCDISGNATSVFGQKARPAAACVAPAA